MTKCKNELVKSKKKTLILGVTILTSMNENEIREVGYSDNLNDQVLKMAKLCHESKLDGVVCSSQESKLIKSNFKENFICVCPGIRSDNDKNNDQKRISTPKVAAASGADYIVVGRPITTSNNPLASLMAIKKEFDESARNII
jgi:orotidine-5'-phosphate decarboxylase